jgi:hypothetical protein
LHEGIGTKRREIRDFPMRSSFQSYWSTHFTVHNSTVMTAELSAARSLLVRGQNGGQLADSGGI